MADMYSDVSLGGIADVTGIPQWWNRMNKPNPIPSSIRPDSPIGKVYNFGNNFANEAFNQTGIPATASAIGRSIATDQADQDFYDKNGHWPTDAEREQFLKPDQMAQSAQAVTDAQNAQNNNQQNQTQGQANGGTSIPNPQSAPPAATASAINQNVANGTTPPQQQEVKVPNVDEQLNAMLQNTGKKVSFDENKVPVWWKSTSFNAGLLNFGLTLLSGGNLAQGFAAGANTFQQLHGEEKRSAWADDLLKAGYDPAYVEQWKQDGKADTLEKGSPEAAANRKLQQRSDVEALRSQMIANSPEALQQKADMANLQMANIKDEMATRREELGLRRDALKQKADAAKLAAGNVGSRDVRMAETGSLDFQTAKPMVQRANYFAHGAQTLGQMNQARQKGDAQGERIAFNQALMDVTRGEMGGQATMDPEHMKALGLDPSWFVSGPGGIALKGGVITDDMRNALTKAITMGHSASLGQMNDLKRNRYNTLAAQYGPERARAIVNMYWSGDPITDQNAQDDGFTFQ